MHESRLTPLRLRRHFHGPVGFTEILVGYARKLLCFKILLQLMVLGETGQHSLNVLIHVVEVHRHVNGNVTVIARPLEETLVQEMKMRRNHVTLKYVQVKHRTL